MRLGEFIPLWWGSGDATSNPFSDNLPVIISGAAIVLAALATAIAGIYNRSRDAKSRREPTVAEVWDRLRVVESKLDDEREARISVEDRYRTLRDAFFNYIERVKRGGYAVDLLPDERSALEDTRDRASISPKASDQG